jgi:hypothetical protein
MKDFDVLNNETTLPYHKKSENSSFPAQLNATVPIFVAIIHKIWLVPRQFLARFCKLMYIKIHFSN